MITELLELPFTRRVLRSMLLPQNHILQPIAPFLNQFKERVWQKNEDTATT